MWDDGYESSHPLQVKLETTSEIISVYDKITSSKGAAVMRMVESVVGPTQFKTGLKVKMVAYFING
jgi:aminopeptidase N